MYTRRSFFIETSFKIIRKLSLLGETLCSAKVNFFFVLFFFGGGGGGNECLLRTMLTQTYL